MPKSIFKKIEEYRNFTLYLKLFPHKAMSSGLNIIIWNFSKKNYKELAWLEPLLGR